MLDRERGFWATVDVAGQPTRIPGRMAQISGNGQPQVRRRAPAVGEHTDEVLRDWLGRVAPAVERVGAAR